MNTGQRGVSTDYQQEVIFTNHFLQFRMSQIGVVLLRLHSSEALLVFQVYVYTMAGDDNEVEDFYNELESTHFARSTYTIVMVASMPNFDMEGKPIKRYIARYGIGEQNDKNDKIAAMAETNRLFLGNTWFGKKAGRRKAALLHKKDDKV